MVIVIIMLQLSIEKGFLVSVVFLDKKNFFSIIGTWDVEGTVS